LEQALIFDKFIAGVNQRVLSDGRIRICKAIWKLTAGDRRTSQLGHGRFLFQLANGVSLARKNRGIFAWIIRSQYHFQ